MSAKTLAPWADLLALLVMPVIACWAAAQGVPGAPAIMLMSVLVTLAMLALAVEHDRPGLRALMPTVVLAALAAAGRVLFAPLPDVKPVSAIVIVAGVSLGSRSGFCVGALAALASNAFFGQGPWTPLQMYAWGLIGYLAGLMARAGLLRHRRALLGFGFVSGLLYGAIMNSWHVLGFVRPLTWQSVVIAFTAGFPWDFVHGVATVAFLMGIGESWVRTLRRIVVKFELRERLDVAADASAGRHASVGEGDHV